MVTIFNRKKLFLDTNSEAVAKVWSALRANGIPYVITTKGLQSSLVRGFHAKLEASVQKGAMSYSSFRDGNRQFIYSIYVRRKDFARAKALI